MLPWPLMLVWASLQPFCSWSLNQGVGSTSLHLEALGESFLPLPARGGLAVPWRVDASLLPLPPGHVVTLPASLVSASSPCKTAYWTQGPPSSRMTSSALMRLPYSR